MSNKFKKIDKEFLLTDDSVNCYGYRLLTSGYLIDEYKKNPIGYAMHNRTDGVLVRWEDLRAEGDKIYGKPVINLSHPMGQRTVDEIENGFLNAASVGHIVMLEFSEEASLKLDGQTGPTITKWFNRECSLVDVPGNFNALRQLFDADDREINLADFSNTKISKMKKLEFTPAQLAQMNLKADADEATVLTAFNDLSAKVTKAEKDLNDLKASTEKGKVISIAAEGVKAGKISQVIADKLSADYATNPEGLKNLLADMSAPATTSVKDILTKAVADKKINVELSAKFELDYKEKPDALKSLIDSMPVYESIVDSLTGDKNKSKAVTDLAAKSWTDLMESGEMEKLKKDHPDLYAQKYKEEFGKDLVATK